MAKNTSFEPLKLHEGCRNCCLCSLASSGGQFGVNGCGLNTLHESSGIPCLNCGYIDNIQQNELKLDYSVSLTTAVKMWSHSRPLRRVLTYVNSDGCEDCKPLTFAALEQQTAIIASTLVSKPIGLQHGDRAILVFNPSCDFLVAFLACLRCGVVPVPVCPPDPTKLDVDFEKLRYIVTNCSPSVILSHDAYMDLIGSALSIRFFRHDIWNISRWISITKVLQNDFVISFTDSLPNDDDIAFLQYTSGSTADPKGVMVTHRNLRLQLHAIFRSTNFNPMSDLCVSWLPHFHDMGLIAGLLEGVISGSCTILFSPVAFIRDPLLWMRIVSRYRGTHIIAPNYAYSLTARKAVHDPSLDLSNIKFCGTAAETIRSTSIAAFTRTFQLYGFRSSTFNGMYGLAEHTLMATTGGAQRYIVVDRTLLERSGKAREVNEKRQKGEESKVLVSCGRPLNSVKLRIVDVETLERCPSMIVGEIWLQSDHVALGYWKRCGLTNDKFAASLSGESGIWLRTGDLGFIDDSDDCELFVTGRIKDIIIICGRNYSPEDIEITIMESDDKNILRPGSSAAFSISGHDIEQLVVCVELTTVAPQRLGSGNAIAIYESIVSSICQAISQVHGILPTVVVLLPRRSILKTTSGKISRHRCCQAFLDGIFNPIYTANFARDGVTFAPLHYKNMLRSMDTDERRMNDLRGRIVNHFYSLGFDSMNIHTNMFSSVGIDSMSAIRLHSLLESNLDTKLPPMIVFDNPTPASLAKATIRCMSESSTKTLNGKQDEAKNSGVDQTIILASEPAPQTASANAIIGVSQSSGNPAALIVLVIVATMALYDTIDRCPQWLFQKPSLLFVGEGMEVGWMWGRLRDVTDDVWMMWIHDMLPCIITQVVVHIALKSVLSVFCLEKYFKNIATCIILTIFSLVYTHGSIAIVAICAALANYTIVHISRRYLRMTENRVAKITINYGLPLIMNHIAILYGDVTWQEGLGDSWAWLDTYAGWIPGYFPFDNAFRYVSLRMISFNVDTSPETNENGSCLHYLNYLFYSPTYHYGPLISFKLFNNQFDNTTSIARPLRFVFYDFTLLVANVLMVETMLHFVYYPALVFFDLFDELTASEWLFYGVCFLWFRSAQMAIMHRFGRLWAEAVDGIVLPDDLNVDMMTYTINIRSYWKWVHASLNQYFVRYIFIPLGGGYTGIWAVMLFSGLWHSISQFWMGFAIIYALALSAENWIDSQPWFPRHNICIRSINQSIVIILSMHFTSSGRLMKVDHFIIFSIAVVIAIFAVHVLGDAWKQLIQIK